MAKRKLEIAGRPTKIVEGRTWDMLQDLADATKAEVGVKIEGANDCGWSCELTWTPKPEGHPRVSLVWLVIGYDENAALQKAVDAFYETRYTPVIGALKDLS